MVGTPRWMSIAINSCASTLALRRERQMVPRTRGGFQKTNVRLPRGLPSSSMRAISLPMTPSASSRGFPIVAEHATTCGSEP